MNIFLRQTCGACPEQYDVEDLEYEVELDVYRTVGYIRLRWGHLRCDVPDVGGRTIYSHYFDDGLKGCFDSEEEREFHLNRIKEAVYKHYGYEMVE